MTPQERFKKTQQDGKDLVAEGQRLWKKYFSLEFNEKMISFQKRSLNGELSESQIIEFQALRDWENQIKRDIIDPIDKKLKDNQNLQDRIVSAGFQIITVIS